MVASGRGGACAVYPVVETVQRDHICHIVRAPAQIAPVVAASAAAIAERAVAAIGGIGVFGIELFATADAGVYNEIPPRPHNSRHHSIEGCVPSPFENPPPAVLRLPPGRTEPRASAPV